MSSSLDSSKHNRNSCRVRWSLEGHLKDEKHYSRFRCKAWQCPGCGPRKASRVLRAILEVATQMQLRRFLTLTLNPRYCDAEDSVPYIKNCWAKFRTYLKPRYQTPIPFIYVVELQQSGYAHLHILLDRFIEQYWIKEAWQAVGGGEIVDIPSSSISIGLLPTCRNISPRTYFSLRLSPVNGDTVHREVSPCFRRHRQGSGTYSKYSNHRLNFTSR